MDNNKIKRIGIMIIGILFIGFSVTLFRLANGGADPFSSMNLGVCGYFHLSFGVYQAIVNIFLLIIVFFTARHYIGIGTVVNMLLVGLSSDFFLHLFQEANTSISTLPIKLSTIAIGVVLVCFGCALYIAADIGIAPYDAVAYIIELKTNGKLPFKWARILSDTICVGIGFSFGYTFGITTIVTMFFTGPILQFFLNIISKITIEKCRLS